MTSVQLRSLGGGWSDPGPTRISVGMLADDLRALTEAVPIDPPFMWSRRQSAA